MLFSRCGILLPLLCSAVVLRGATLNADETEFNQHLQPLLSEYCLTCHGPDDPGGGIRLDQLDGSFPSERFRLWSGIRSQIAKGVMPPKDADQPSDEQRAKMLRQIDEALQEARSRPDEYNGSVRRLTVRQYRNTLRDLLGIREEITEGLPPDAVSKDGFSNNSQINLLSPLQVEAYLNIAEQALDLCLVDEDSPPRIQSVRMDLGKDINPEPFPEKLVMGPNNALLENADFVVSQPRPAKPFDFEAVAMRTKYRFNEGYAGNATVRGWRDYDSIYHSVFACVRGTPGYPKGRAWETTTDGLLVRPAIPQRELFGVDSTYGHQANFKLAMRELPPNGNFRITVQAARYDDGLLLEPSDQARTGQGDGVLIVRPNPEGSQLDVPDAGVYQVDVHLKEAPKEQPWLDLALGNRQFSGQVKGPGFLALRLPAGDIFWTAKLSSGEIDQLVFTPLSEDDDVAQRFLRFERRVPWLGVHIGLRRDCGTSMTPVHDPVPVSSADTKSFVFEDAILNYPGAVLPENNDNYLAGVRDIAIRSEYSDGRDMPRLLIKSVHIEGPYFESWPPKTHRRILMESDLPAQSPKYADLVIHRFAERAWRRPLTDAERNELSSLQRKFLASSSNFRQSIRNTLSLILTSPQFLFLIEQSTSPQPEPLNDYELAAKLSYFLWNSPPDTELLGIAATGQLRSALNQQVDRMVADARFERSMSQFATEWLDLKRFDVVDIDHQKFPKMTPHTRKHLRREPVHFLTHLMRENRSLRNLIRSDYVVADETVAAWYGIADRVNSGANYIPVAHDRPGVGGILTQAAILSGLSDGRESNPIKRGAWLARKIIAEPPPDPPPNVPELPEDQDNLSLREKLEQHRNQPGCAGCHSKIDPWGLPFEQYSAGGLLKKQTVAADSTLPDGTDVSGLTDLQEYLAEERMEQVAFSFLKHIATYAVGRHLTWNEIEFLRKQAVEFESVDYAARDMVRFLVQSDLFLMK